MAPKTKPDVRFAVDIRESPWHGGSLYLHFTARAVIPADAGRHSGRPGLFDPDSSELPHDPAHEAFTGLVITAQADEDSMRRPGHEWYGLDVGYDLPLVNADTAETAVKVLRTISRGVARLTAELGRPATLAQYATYVARALTAGSHPFARPVDPAQDYEGTGYRSLDPDALAVHIAAECTEWRKRNNADPRHLRGPVDILPALKGEDSHRKA